MVTMAADTVMGVMDMVVTVESVPLNVTMAVDTVMVVMDMVVTVESVPLNLTMAMDTAAVMDMAVTDMVDTVERDPLNHTTDMVDTDHTEDTDMAVMATAMVVKSYLQEAKGFYYLIFRK